jgi:hypothetical protein
VRYMLGWSLEETSWPVFERWAKAAID